MNKIDILRESTFGSRIAEDEQDVLQSYFVETEHWRKVISGSVDVVYGPKGSGRVPHSIALFAIEWASFDPSPHSDTSRLDVAIRLRIGRRPYEGKTGDRETGRSPASLLQNVRGPGPQRRARPKSRFP